MQKESKTSRSPPFLTLKFVALVVVSFNGAFPMPSKREIQGVAWLMYTVLSIIYVHQSMIVACSYFYSLVARPVRGPPCKPYLVSHTLQVTYT